MLAPSVSMQDPAGLLPAPDCPAEPRGDLEVGHWISCFHFRLVMGSRTLYKLLVSSHHEYIDYKVTTLTILIHF